jgi:hypothetical protein
MGPSESNNVARVRAASDHPSAGPTANSRCCAPSSRRVRSHSAKLSELIARPRLSSSTAVTDVRPAGLASHSSNASSLLKSCVPSRAKAPQRTRYFRTSGSYPSLAALRAPIRARVICTTRRISHPVPRQPGKESRVGHTGYKREPAPPRTAPILARISSNECPVF